VSKPRVYWRPTWLEDQDPDDACWAVKIGNGDFGIGTWQEAYAWAYLTESLRRIEER